MLFFISGHKRDKGKKSLEYHCTITVVGAQGYHLLIVFCYESH